MSAQGFEPLPCNVRVEGGAVVVSAVFDNVSIWLHGAYENAKGFAPALLIPREPTDAMLARAVQAIDALPISESFNPHNLARAALTAAMGGATNG